MANNNDQHQHRVPFPGTSSNAPEQDLSRTSAAAEPQQEDTEEKVTDGLPGFMKKFTRPDWILWWCFIGSGVYGMALIPFRAVLLVDHPFLYTVLSGSSLAVLAQAAQEDISMVRLAGVIIVATLSMIKFLPLFYLVGRRWGPEFIDYQFMGKPPLWFRKLENFIYRRLGLSFFLAYIPFSPIPGPILTIMAGIVRAKPWLIAAYVFVFGVILKSFYAYLGLTFGTEARGALIVIDRYVMWITVGLIVYLFVSASWKNSRKKS